MTVGADQFHNLLFHIDFVCNQTCQIEIVKPLKAFSDFVVGSERLTGIENEPRIGNTGEVKSNVTDNESAKMVTSHGTIQGYNGQALVDSKHQIILHGEAFGSGQDHEHLPPIVDGAKENLKTLGHSEDYFKGKILSADTGYHSQTNLCKCEEEGLDAFIPDREFRKRDPRFERYQSNRSGNFPWRISGMTNALISICAQEERFSGFR